jgi:MFS family permease
MQTSAPAPSGTAPLATPRPGDPPNERDRAPRTRAGLALAATLAVQASATVAMTAPSVLAPVVAPMLDVAPHRVGWMVGLAYCSAMFSGLIGGQQVGKHGAIRMSQWALYACMVGLILAAAASRPLLWALLIPAAVAIGIGYGLPNPAASRILSRHVPSHRRGLYFSIKQTGVPVGVGLTGLIVPALLWTMSWPLAVLVLASSCLCLALILNRARVLDDRETAEGPSPSTTGPTRFHATMIEPLRRVWQQPALRRLGVASMTYSMTQLCFVTFLVSYLKLEHSLSLAVAAGILSASQVLSVLTRVMWGQVSDRWIAPTRLLGLLGVAMAIAAALLGSLPADAPVWLMLAAALGCAATSMAWNGVFFADLAHRVPAAQLATVTGGTQFLTFCGAMIGPVAFSSLVGPLGSHAATYVALALAPLAVGLWLLAGSRPSDT